MYSSKYYILRIASGILVITVIGLIGAVIHLHNEITTTKQKTWNGVDVHQRRMKRSADVTAEPFNKMQGGAIYTRWGRSSCPATDSEIVYEGVVGGSDHNTPGGAANYLCLPRKPQWNKFTDAADGNRAYMYGAEFETNGDFFDKTNAGNRPLMEQDAMCAICRSRTRVSQVMIPAKRECPAGWTFEYEGYLMTGYYNQKAQHEYICVDGAPEVDPEGYRNDNGALLYHVQAVCGSLPCPHYVNGRELTCVVCTK